MDEAERKSMHIFKVIIVGNLSVGKTALAVRYVKNYFSESYESTPGINLLRKVIEEKDKTIILDIWDTGGQEKFNYLRNLYYKGASGALVCYDITNRKSFEDVPLWLGEIDKNCGEIPVFLVGNKKDLELKRSISFDEGKELATTYDIPFIETSAKTGENVVKTFSDLVKRIAEQRESI